MFDWQNVIPRFYARLWSISRICCWTAGSKISIEQKKKWQKHPSLLIDCLIFQAKISQAFSIIMPYICSVYIDESLRRNINSENEWFNLFFANAKIFAMPSHQGSRELAPIFQMNRSLHSFSCCVNFLKWRFSSGGNWNVLLWWN